MFSSHFYLSKIFKIFGWLLIIFCVPIAVVSYNVIITIILSVIGGMMFLAIGAFLEWQGIVGTAFIDMSKIILSKTCNINNVEINDMGRVCINPDKEIQQTKDSSNTSNKTSED